MAFNKEKFIADAKAAGYGDDEINAELASSSSESSGFDQKDSNNSGWDSGRPALATTPGATTAAIPQAGSRVDAESKRLAEKKVEKEQAAPLIPEFAQNPLMLAGAAAAGGAAVMGYKTLKDKMANSASAVSSERREPPMFGAQRLDEPAWSASTAQTAPLSQEEMMSRLQGLADETSAVNEPAFGATTAPPAAPAAAPVNTKLQELQAKAAAGIPATGEFVGPMQPVGPPEFTGPRRPVVPTPPAALAATTAPVTPTPTAVLPERVQTAITGVPKTVQDQYAKEGKVVLKGYGVGDRSLTNTYGIPAYAKIIDYFNEGKPIGDDANYQIIRKKINQGVPASLAAEFAAKLPGSEAEAGNFGKAFGETGAYTKDGKIVTSPAAMKKAVAGGGALFLATAFPNIVNAAESASKGDYAKAGGQAAGVAYGAMGPLAQLLSGTGNAGLSAEEEARQLRMRDYALKAGRGVAQSYDTRRLIGAAPPGQRELIPGMK